VLVSSSLGRLLLAVALSSLLRTPSRISRLQQDPSPPAPTSGVRSRPNSDCGRVSDRPVPVHDESDAERAVACAPCELERGSRISNSRPYPLTATSAFAAISAPHSNARLAVSIGRRSARSTASITPPAREPLPPMACARGSIRVVATRGGELGVEPGLLKHRDARGAELAQALDDRGTSRNDGRQN